MSQTNQNRPQFDNMLLNINESNIPYTPFTQNTIIEHMASGKLSTKSGLMDSDNKPTDKPTDKPEDKSEKSKDKSGDNTAKPDKSKY
jgi:hypothetical protein